jgi:hypothetical protein
MEKLQKTALLYFKIFFWNTTIFIQKITVTKKYPIIKKYSTLYNLSHRKAIFFQTGILFLAQLKYFIAYIFFYKNLLKNIKVFFLSRSGLLPI